MCDAVFPVIVVIGSLIGFAGTLVYLSDTLFGGTEPDRVSWLVWCVAPLTAFAASWESGVRWAALPTFMAGFGPLLVLIASFANAKAYWKLHTLDYACGACAFLALALWAITSDPSIAIVLSITTSGLGAAPTIVKEWRNPETESVAAYLGGIVSGLSAFTAVTSWNLPSVAFPSYMVLISVILVAPLLRKKLKPGIGGIGIRSTPEIIDQFQMSCLSDHRNGSDGLISVDASRRDIGETDEEFRSCVQLEDEWEEREEEKASNDMAGGKSVKVRTPMIRSPSNVKRSTASNSFLLPSFMFAFIRNKTAALFASAIMPVTS